MRNDRNLCYTLVVVGALALLNAIVNTLSRPANCRGHVISIHWINTIILLAGLAPFIFYQKTIKTYTAIVVTNLISFGISIACTISDVTNIYKVLLNNDAQSLIVDQSELDTRKHLFIYNCVDLVLCTLAACISHQLIKNRIAIAPILHLVDSRKMQGLGVSLIIVSVLGILVHLFQRLIAVHHNMGVVLDMYTIDEFSWLVISLTTGVCVFLSSQGNQLVQTCSFVLSGALIYPAFFYTWLDYRITISIHSEFLLKQSIFSICLNFAQIVVLCCTFLTFTTSIRDMPQVAIGRPHKLTLVGFAVFFLAVAIGLVDTALYSLFAGQFRQVFTTSDHKLPFFALFLSLFSGVSVYQKFNYITIPATLIIAILAVNSTYLHIFAYLYIRWNGFNLNKDILFVTKEEYEKRVNVSTSTVSQYIDNYLHVSSLIAAFGLAIFLMIVSRSHSPNDENDSALSSKEIHERRIRNYGVAMLIGAICVLIVGISTFFINDLEHPILTIYLEIYQIVVALGITTFALFQVLVSEKLSKFPIFTNALLMLSIIRCVDILTQIDYRDAGESPLGWLVHVIVEYLSIFAHFLTIGEILQIQGAGRELLEPADVPMSFENPIGNATDENGYILLRANETN
ncbi:unnamed protein product [Caenorhabditis bovis]|uniref:Uncharacterized protein n=1 Tax=Caenorhabditis bovis TaxID=2654633 RepID=A0A8S1FCH1_9PELO|nr:unnamed protein product [Caenorhabditis bovis]